LKILFLHNNFPAQFGVFGQYLSKNGWDVVFGTQREGIALPGGKTFQYKPHREVSKTSHPYIATYENAVLNGQAVARAGFKLEAQGYTPDIVVAHSGWGPGLFVKDVWPTAKYVGYFEWYYRGDSPDIMFGGREPNDLDNRLRTRSRNAAINSDLIACDAAICPTEFQKAQFPSDLKNKLTVMHDGIDTDYYAPKKDARLTLPNLDLSNVDEIITYVARGMEPYRGFPEFMKALEVVLKERPGAHAVIVGEDRVAYGAQLPEGDSYKRRVLEECDLDWDRVHFTGLLPRDQYAQVLEASAVHVYLTVPFVLSWSMMEAMSAGCAIVASDVAPVREIADQAEGALSLVDMVNGESIASGILGVLRDKTVGQDLGVRARRLIEDNYTSKKLFAEKKAWLEALITL